MPAMTFNEAATELRVSIRAMHRIVQRHPHYYSNGRRKLFTTTDISQIQAALREEAACSSSLGVPVKRHGISGELSTDAAMTKALRLLRKR